MLIFLKAEENRMKEKDGYEIPSFALRKKERKEPVSEEPDDSSLTLEETLRRRHSNHFLKTLDRFLKERKLDEVKVYKKAMISRQYYSKIRSGNIPKKNSILAIGLSMRLNKAEMSELLQSAGFAFSDTRKQDVIVRWCMDHGIYDVMEVNMILSDHHANLLR